VDIWVGIFAKIFDLQSDGDCFSGNRWIIQFYQMVDMFQEECTA
jgi:hypothetical protein